MVRECAMCGTLCCAVFKDGSFGAWAAVCSRDGHRGAAGVVEGRCRMQETWKRSRRCEVLYGGRPESLHVMGKAACS